MRKGGDDVADDAAEFFPLLEQRNVCAFAAEEVGRRHARGTAADHGNAHAVLLFALGCERTDDVIKTAACRNELRVADADAFLIEIAGTLVHAVMTANASRDERQRVFLEDEPERSRIFAFADKLDVFGNILMDRAAMRAGRREAGGQRDFFIELALRNGLDGLFVAHVALAAGRKVGDLAHGHAVKRLVGLGLELIRHLREPLVAAGLEQRCCERDRPDACVEQLDDIKGIDAAGEGETELSVELRADALGHLDGERVERAAAHVHFTAGQLAARDFDREGVGQLETEGHAVFLCL